MIGTDQDHLQAESRGSRRRRGQIDGKGGKQSKLEGGEGRNSKGLWTMEMNNEGLGEAKINRARKNSGNGVLLSFTTGCCRTRTNWRAEFSGGT